MRTNRTPSIWTRFLLWTTASCIGGLVYLALWAGLSWINHRLASPSDDGLWMPTAMCMMFLIFPFRMFRPPLSVYTIIFLNGAVMALIAVAVVKAWKHESM